MNTVIRVVEVLLLVIPFLVGKANLLINGDECWADSAHGSIGSSCGTEARPCKTINRCLDGKKWHRQVIILQKQVLKTTINVKRSVSIIGRNNAVITRSDASVLINVIGVSIELTNIQFKDTGIRVLDGGNTTIDKCMFINSYVKITKGVIVNVTNSIFQHYSAGRGETSALSMEDVLTSIVTDCEFRKNTAWRHGGAILIRNTRYSTIQKTIFVSNLAELGGAVSLQIAIKVSEILISNCLFTKNTARSKDDFMGDVGGAVIGKVSEAAVQTGSIRIIKCHFINNDVQRNTPWPGKGGAMYLEMNNIHIEECYFNRNKAAEGGAIYFNRRGPVELCLCTFLKNKARTGGAINMYRTSIEKEDESISASRVFIEKTTFSNNKADFGGAITVVYFGKKQPQIFTPKTILDCSFFNNSASTIGQSIYSNQDLTIKNIFLWAFESINVYHIQCETRGVSIRLSNITISLYQNKGSQIKAKSSGLYLSAPYLLILSNIRLMCPFGFNVVYKTSSSTIPDSSKIVHYYLGIDCSSCPYNFYTLERGAIDISEIDYTLISSKIKNNNCSKCQVGGVCDVDARALDNYWGYRDSQSQVSFKVCPERYCCSADTVPCNTYNTCALGRRGLLCGECTDGYKQSFITNDCIPTDNVECDIESFVIYLILYTLFYTVAFVCITNAKDIIMCIKVALVSKCRNREQGDNAVENSSRINGNTDGFSIAAFVQITILHFQVASLLKVKFQDRTFAEDSSDDDIRDYLSDVFNFRFSIYQNVCPSDNLTLPNKEMILFGMQLATFAYLVLIGTTITILKTLWSKVYQHENLQSNLLEETALCMTTTAQPKMRTKAPFNLDRTLSATEDDNLPKTISQASLSIKKYLTIVNRLQMTFIKLIKMYYTPITKAALQMVHCVEIMGTYHLFVYGSHVCYSQWQICILVVILPAIVLFPISFELALRLLQKQMISPKTFVIALACPYIAVLLYIFNVKQETVAEDDAFVNRVVAAEQGLYVEDKRSFVWQIIQFYRTFLINLLAIFLINPVYRSLAFGSVFLVFVIHDKHRLPYKNWFLNQMQCLSSRCLLLITLCNVIPSTSFMADVSSVPSISVVMKTLSVLELVLYAVVPLSLPLWKIWEYAEEKRGKKIR